jgi:ribonuclease H-related protein
MPSQYEKELRTRATQLIPMLARDGITAKLDEGSFGEFHVKLNTQFNGSAVGNIVVYYAPSKQTFTIQTSEIRGELLRGLIEKSVSNTPSLASRIAPYNPSKPKVASAKPVDKAKPAFTGLRAYVDGSFVSGKVGYGAVILKDGASIQEFFGRVLEDLSTRQVAGELKATLEVMRWCEENNIAQIDIYYDYTGIEKWARGKWQANLPLTQHYQDYMRKTAVKVRFFKVQSHTGDHWNDVADELAKKGALNKS